MTVRVTAAQARALLGAGTAQGAAKKTRTKTAVPAKECAPNRCTTCGYVTKGETDEARHNADTGHARFESTAITR